MRMAKHAVSLNLVSPCRVNRFQEDIAKQEGAAERWCVMNSKTGQAAKLVEQLRERGIRDERVLAAIAHTPRDIFVGPSDRVGAYQDIPLPIGCGQTISQPYVVAYMTEKLGVESGQDILEIGTGSGYQTVILAGLCRHVYTIERYDPLLEEAKGRFAELGIENVTAKAGDGSKGWPEPRAFDRIIVTAAASEMPHPLIDQLKAGGRMILPVGKRVSEQSLVLVEKTETGVETHELLPVRFVPLIS